MHPGNVLTRVEFPAITTFSVAARTSTTNGSAADCTAFEGVAIAYLASAAGTGTTPTLDVKLQDSDDGSSWADISGATFTQVTTVASTQRIPFDVSAARKFVRAVATIAGTSPSFTFGVHILGVKKVASA